ncbi:uncharacterized protein LOC105180989 isoform X2 [Harpegnathos saltator]|nr:uncharacterized protein LOC105180989 isoform X2 [Harpegnathos saltator]
MQNWNQWQLPAGAVTTPVPQPPLGYAAATTPVTDPMALMQSYMQYYNQPAPSGYTPEQWATTQQQGWAQWQQWQQQYQQWQAQYGDKYQETMKHLSAQNINLAASQVPHMQPPPPLPKEDTARPPPLPPVSAGTTHHQFTNVPPPHQNNLPLFPTKESTTTSALPQASVTNYPPPNHQQPPPPLPGASQQQHSPPLPPETESRREPPGGQAEKRNNDNNVSAVDDSEPNSGSSAKKLKLDEDEELTDAEKTFDAQFKQWEEQFNKWKQQNVNHPDKTQYKQYEAKWTSWREKLLERREQMRRKREQQKQASAAKAIIVAETADKSKSVISGDDKILNLLSNTENQSLINNLLGIGKTLGLTGKQQSDVAPTVPSLPPPPPPPPESSNSGASIPAQVVQQAPPQAVQQAPPPHSVQQVLPQVPLQQNMMGSNVAMPSLLPSWPNQQQWDNNQQYNPRMEAPYGMLLPTIHHFPAPSFAHSVMSPNFAQPPPNLLNNNNGPPPNFSQPPPNYPPNNNPECSVTLQNAARGPASGQEPLNADMMRFARHPADRGNNFDSGQQSNFLRRTGEPPDHRFLARGDGVANSSGNEQDQFMRPGDPVFNRPNEPFNERADAQQQRFRRGDRGFSADLGNNSLNGSMNFHPNNEARFGPSMNERFAGGNNRFGQKGNDRFPPLSDRPFVSEHDRFGGGERFAGPETDRFGRGAGKEHRFDRPDNERFGPNDRFERFPDLKDRFPQTNDRFGPNMNEHVGPNDRFNRGNNPADCFDPKDANDHRRDSFSGNSRVFGRKSGFSPPKELPPELRKLMEKRKAACDVFKPSFLPDSEKTSVGSLSESFKKIAGDSPFRSSFDFPKIRPFGPPGGPPSSGFSFIPGGKSPPPFQPHPFAPNSATPYDHHLRGAGHPFSSNNNVHDDELSVPFIPGLRHGPFTDNFPKHGGLANYNERTMEKDMEDNLQDPNPNPNSNQQAQSTNNQSQSPAKYLANTEADINVESSNNLETDNVPNMKDAEMTQLTNEADGTTVEQNNNPVMIDDPTLKSADNEEGNKVSSNDDSSQQPQQQEQEQDNNCEEKQNIESNIDDKDESIQTKKSESLPFMGENDPPPEDLNIEPPPELPNLGPVLTNPNSGPQDTVGPFNEPFDGKGLLELPSHSASAGQFHDMRLRETEFPRMGAPFKFPGPPPLSNPLLNPRFQRPSAFQPLSHGDNAQLGPKDGQFGFNTPGDSGRFSPKRPNDEQYPKRDRSDDSPSENPRNPNSGYFGLMNEPFGGPRPMFGKFGPRAPMDSPFAPRNPGPFGLRSNIPPFGQRGGPSDMYRHPNDEPQFSFLGPNNNNRFGKPNEAPFNRRWPNEGPPAIGPRGPNDSMLGGLRVPPLDAFSQGRRSPKAFNENRFDSRDFNDGPFGSDFKDKPLAIKGPMGDPSCIRDYMNRSGNYIRREQQFKDDKRQFDSSDESFDRNTMDTTEPWKDNVDYTKRKPPLQDPFKKEFDDARTRGNFNDDQCTSIDRNPSNVAQFDERSKLETKVINYSGSNEAINLDRSKFHGSTLFTQRPQPVLSASGGEFCASRQFNYNHGEVSSGGEKVVEYTPSKVIDYEHMSRPTTVDQHLPPPVQCFDYSHGESKPVERCWDQQQHQSRNSREDSRNWVENEQSIKDYVEKMRSSYENMKKEKMRSAGGYNYEKSGYEARRLDYTKQRKEHHKDWQQHQQQASDRRPCGERERRDSEDRKERSSVYDSLEEQRLFFERDSSTNDGQGDRNVRRERVQETCETVRRETNKDSDKDDSRSKGSVHWQENSNKNTVDAKLPDTSFLDTKKNVAETASVPKILDLAKISNYTMVDDLLCPPGRQNRPPKIAIILRGPPGSGKSFVTKLIKDKEIEQGGSAPRILSLDDYFLVEKEVETKDDNGKKVTVKEMIYEYEEAMEQSYLTSLVKAFKKNVTDGFFNFIILDCINERIADYEEMWSFAKTKGFKVYVCEMEMDLQICLKRNIHNRTEDEINRIIDYFEPTPSYHLKLDVNSMLQEQAIEEVDMEDSQQEIQEKPTMQNEDSQDSHEDTQDTIGVSKWEKMEAEDKLDRLDGLAKKKNEGKPQTMEDFLQVPDYYNMEDTSGKKRVRWADLEERKEQEKMRAVGFVVGHTNWDRMMDPTKGGSALTRTKYI